MIVKTPTLQMMGTTFRLDSARSYPLQAVGMRLIESYRFAAMSVS